MVVVTHGLLVLVTARTLTSSRTWRLRITRSSMFLSMPSFLKMVTWHGLPVQRGILRLRTIPSSTSVHVQALQATVCSLRHVMHLPAVSSLSRRTSSWWFVRVLTMIVTSICVVCVSTLRIWLTTLLTTTQQPFLHGVPTKLQQISPQRWVTVYSLTMHLAIRRMVQVIRMAVWTLVVMARRELSSVTTVTTMKRMQ